MMESPSYGMPFHSVVIDQGDADGNTLLRVEHLFSGGQVAHGCVTLERVDYCDILLFYDGGIHSAARLADTRVAGLEVATLFRRAAASTARIRILFGTGVESSSAQELNTVFLEPDSKLGGRAQLLRQGEPTAILSPVFRIGKAADANLRLSGLRMKPVQATIVREGQGAYRLLPVPGGRAVRLGGKSVPASGSLLTSGTVFHVGNHELVFVFTDDGP